MVLASARRISRESQRICRHQQIERPLQPRRPAAPGASGAAQATATSAERTLVPAASEPVTS